MKENEKRKCIKFWGCKLLLTMDGIIYFLYHILPFFFEFLLFQIFSSFIAFVTLKSFLSVGYRTCLEHYGNHTETQDSKSISLQSFHYLLALI